MADDGGTDLVPSPIAETVLNCVKNVFLFVYNSKYDASDA